MKGSIASLLRTLHQIGKLRLTEKGPTILGQPVTIVPRSLFTRMITLSAEGAISDEVRLSIYHVMKDVVYEFCDELDEDNTMESAEILRTLMHLTKMNGYGHIEINDYSEPDTLAAFYVRDLPSTDIDKQYDTKGDIYWAGMLAGGMSYVFQENVDGLETQCVLEGQKSCRFVVARAHMLQRMYPDLFEETFQQAVPTPEVDHDG